MARMRHSRERSQTGLREACEHAETKDFYEGEAAFTGTDTVTVNGGILKGGDLFIVTGSRPMIPPVKGLDTVDCLTSETVPELTKKPESLIIGAGTRGERRHPRPPG